MRRAKRAAWLVWTLWAFMSVAALLFVARFGCSIPYWDDWDMVPVIAGDQSVDAHWLWSEHNGHRIPLPRLLLLGLYKLTGADFRAEMYFNVLLLSATAFMFIRVAKRQRGRISFTDAFFPLVLLHWGHYENLLWSWQVSFVLPVCIVCILLVLIVQDGIHLSLGKTALVGICLVLLPLCGMPGLLYVPALALWLASAGVFSPPAEGGSRKKYRLLVIWSSVLAALFVTAIYFRNYQGVTGHLSVFHPRSSMITALQFLTGSFGPAAQVYWPLWGVAIVGLLGLMTVALISTFVRRSATERGRAGGLLCFMIAIAGLAGSVGLGRRGYGFANRYCLLAVPALCGVYYAMGVCKWRNAGRGVQIALCALAVFFSPMNLQEGLAYGTSLHGRLQAFVVDLSAGKPIPELLARHASSLCPCPFGGEPSRGIANDKGCVESRYWLRNCIGFHDYLGDRILELSRAGIGYFRLLQTGQTAFREVTLSTASVPDESTGKPRTLQPLNGDQSDLEIVLEEPRFVCGIRVSRSADLDANSNDRPPCLQVFWKSSGQSDFSTCQRYVHYFDQNERTEMIWIYAEVDSLVVNYDNQIALAKDLQLMLLLPQQLAE